MSDMTVSRQLQAGAENVLARDVSFEDYLERYAADYCEWVDGVVIKMAPIHEQHDALTTYIRNLLDVYLGLRPIGRARSAPFVMKLDRGREPDVQIIFTDNPHYTPTGMVGPADICIEVVSPESVERDHGTKLAEYEQGGVPEYWIIDPLRREARFHRLSEAGGYLAYQEDADDFYTTPQLPDFRLHVPTLWATPLPDPLAVVDAVKAMLTEAD